MADSLPLTGERTVPAAPGEEYWFARHEVAYRWVARRLGPGRGRPAIDAGAGEGYGAARLQAAGWRVLALDYDLATARHITASYPAVGVVRANLACMPIADGSVACVACLQVVEHLWDLRGFLADVHRVLAPAGQLLITTPNRLTFSPGLARHERPVNPFHVEEFDAVQLRDLLRGAGFTGIDVLGVHHGPRLAAWRDHTDRGIVAAQVAAALAGLVPDELALAVGRTTWRDFAVHPHSPSWPVSRSQDLLLTATVGPAGPRHVDPPASGEPT